MEQKIITDIEFIVELEKMKSVFRKTKVIGEDRYEDDAQHSWHISTMAMVLEEYADHDVNIDKVIRMLLIHDLVEIYAGDTFGYDTEGYKDKFERETKAADKLFGMIDSEKGSYMRSLWDEFEAEESNDALFALTMDRLQPILSNFYNDGGTWLEHGVKRSAIEKRIAPMKKASMQIWNYANSLLDKAIEQGFVEE